MPEQIREEEVREALWDLGRYLSDELAPLMAADAVGTLLACPPELTAKAVNDWTFAQNRGVATQLSYSDCAFHCLKKIRHIGELDLIPRVAVEAFVADVATWVLEYCPEAERERFARALRHLGDGESSIASTVQYLHRPPGVAGGPPTGAVGGSEGASIGGVPPGHVVVAVPAGTVPVVAPAASAAALTTGGHLTAAAVVAPPQVPADREYAQNLARMGLLMERLESQLKRVEVTGPATGLPNEMLSQFVAAAALSARSSSELAAQLGRLGQFGVQAPVGDLLRSIGQQLPGWVLRSPDGSGASLLPKSRTMDALHRLVTMADGEQETAQRFHQLLIAAAERFNEGNLAQAASMIAVAREVVEEKRIAPAPLATILDRGARAFSEEKLAAAATKTEDHPLLHDVLSFFPALRPEALLTELQEEPKRERRQLLLAILRVHGTATREAVLTQLDLVASRSVPDDQGFFRRNLLFLLRRIPRPAEEGPHREIDHFIALASLHGPLLLVKEAIGALGGVRNERAERALETLLGQVESSLLLGAPRVPHPDSELRGLLDRLTAALAAQETKSAARIVVNHAFREESKLGPTIGRLAVLSRCDLTEDRELVETLTIALEDELPRKLFKFVVKPRTERIVALIQGLSGTRASVARELLASITERFPQEAFARAAAKALAAPPATASLGGLPERAAPGSDGAASAAAPAPGSQTMSGDIDLFGLPNLLQSLATMQVSGILSLRDKDAKPLGGIRFDKGRITGSTAGRLRGDAAIYQMIEFPSPGRFSFAPSGDGLEVEATQPEPLDPVSLLMEGVRRHDELSLARTFVPDDMRLEPTGTKPTVPEAEGDVEFLKKLWALAVAGETALACEAAFPFDSYRTRYALAHWVEAKALRSR